MDKVKIENCIRELLIAIGENPNREGLRETPARVAKMYEEIYEGIQYSNDDIVKMQDKCFQEDTDFISQGGTVWVRDIECVSQCEHHLAPIYDLKITVGYRPQKKVIGLSKIARIADLVCRRLQLQERISSDILYIVRKITESQDIVVIIEGKHGCMTMRGVKKHQSVTRTIQGIGVFEDYKEV